MFSSLITPPIPQKVEAVNLQTEIGRGIALGLCAPARWQSLTLWNPSSIWPNSCCLFMSYSSCPWPSLLQHQLVRKPQRKASAPTHSCSSELPVGAGWLAGSLCCRLLKEHPSLLCLRNAPVFLWVVALKSRGRYRGFIYYIQLFCECKGLIRKWPFTLAEKLVFTLVFHIHLSNSPCLRCFVCPLIPGALPGPGT